MTAEQLIFETAEGRIAFRAVLKSFKPDYLQNNCMSSFRKAKILNRTSQLTVYFYSSNIFYLFLAVLLDY